MKLSHFFTEEVKETKPLTKKQEENFLKPDPNQIKLIAALLTTGNLGHSHSKFEIKDGVISIKSTINNRIIASVNLNTPDKFAREANAIIYSSINIIASDMDHEEAEDYIKKEYEGWIDQVKNMKWETISKNWKDFGPIVKILLNNNIRKKVIES